MSQIDKKFQLSACGGTFDLFHKGHENFLHSAFKYSDKIIIGLTSETFAFPKKTFEKFSDRKISLKKFLDKYSYNAEIVKINDIYGPTIKSDYNFEAIFVTSDSLKGAEEINTKREQFGLSKLKIVKIKLTEASDGKAISSNRIRNGEIDREGNLYIDKNLLSCDYTLPKNLRDRLSRPFGKLIGDFDLYIEKQSLSKKFIISIGDITTRKLLEHRIIPEVSIVDLIVNRIKRFEKVRDLGFKSEKIVEVNNPAGSVTRNLILETKKVFSIGNKVVIKVNGEEDMAVIPVVLASPLGYEIYYGQPGKGVVKIIVTEKIKGEIKNLISKFRRKVL